MKIDPNDPTLQTYYAGTGTSGLWKTTDGGQSWKNITGPYLSYGLGILDIAINPTNPDVIYIATCFGGLGRAYYYGKGIMQTTDGGQTWQTPSNMNFPAWWQIPITKFVMDPNNPNRIVAFGKNYIYRTLDGVNWDSLTVVPQGINGFCNSGGVTWLNPKTVRDAVFMPGNTNSVIVGTDFVSTSTAELWQIDNIFSNNINSGDFHELSGQLSNTYDRFSIDIKKGTTGNPDIVYFGGLTSTNFSIFYIDPNTSMITPYCTVTNNINMSASQCEFKMSQLTNNTFILCGYFFNYY